MPELPGAQVAETPALPNVGAQNVSHDTIETVARWNAQIEFRPVPPDLAALLAQHPEYLKWAAGSIVGSLRFAQ